MANQNQVQTDWLSAATTQVSCKPRAHRIQRGKQRRRPVKYILSNTVTDPAEARRISARLERCLEAGVLTVVLKDGRKTLALTGKGQELAQRQEVARRVQRRISRWSERLGQLFAASVTR